MACSKRLDSTQVDNALEHLVSCYKRSSKLVITGVGKSGIVGRKIAATFSSIGLTSIYLSPLDALHGDLGVVHRGDVALLLSNSGETEELKIILPHLMSRCVASIALVGNVQSSLSMNCDIVLDSSVDREVCPLNLAPTASTAVAMAIGDALASVWMERVGISPTDFATNHPAGSLGKQLTLCVSELMIPACDIQLVPPAAPLSLVIETLTHGTTGRGTHGACLMHKEGDPLTLAGLITDGDLRRTLKQQQPDSWQHLTAASMATLDPINAFPSMLAVDALRLMERDSSKPISVLPVVDSPDSLSLSGLLRLHDLVQAGLA